MRKPLSSILIATCFLAACVSQKKDQPAQATTPSAPPATYPTGDSNAAPKPKATAPAKPSGVQKTFSGLQYEVLKPGTGRRPTIYNQVKVHYHGYLPNGKVFDSSVQRGSPVTFGLTRVITGWKEGIPLMKEGAKYRFTIPPHLAYGQRGQPPSIGPNQTLMFDVELIEVLY